ncbi:MAG: hypothetical protein RL481_2387, partial [Pseudomonadota bacterium]
NRGAVSTAMFRLNLNAFGDPLVIHHTDTE